MGVVHWVGGKGGWRGGLMSAGRYVHGGNLSLLYTLLISIARSLTIRHVLHHFRRTPPTAASTAPA